MSGLVGGRNAEIPQKWKTVFALFLKGGPWTSGGMHCKKWFPLATKSLAEYGLQPSQKTPWIAVVLLLQVGFVGQICLAQWIWNESGKEHSPLIFFFNFMLKGERGSPGPVGPPGEKGVMVSHK